MMSYVGGMNVVLMGATLSPRPTRISPPPVPPKALFPYLTIQQVVGREVESLEGLSGLTNSHMQFNCWSPLYDEAFSLRASIVAALQTVKGAVGSTDLAVDTITDYRYSELYDGSRELHQLILRTLVWWTLP